MSTVFDSTSPSYAGSSCTFRPRAVVEAQLVAPLVLRPVTMPWAERVLACHIVLGKSVCRPCLTQLVHPMQVQLVPVRQASRSGRGPVGRSPRPSSSHYALGRECAGMSYPARRVCVSTVFDSTSPSYAGSSCASRLAQRSRPSWSLPSFIVQSRCPGLRVCWHVLSC